MLVTFVTLVTMFLLKAPQNDVKPRYPHLETAERQDRILIIAPHIDDESIGAGGYAIDAMANGAEVYVVFLTAGDCNRFSARLMNKTLAPVASSYLTVGRTRIGEAKKAMRILGIPQDHYFFLGYPDRGLEAMIAHPTTVIRSSGTRERSVPYDDAVSPGAAYSYDNLMGDMRRVLDIAQPTTVIAPVPFDLHPDHRAAAEITDVALEDQPVPPARLGYLVHSGPILPKSLIRLPKRALMPPIRMQSFSWVTYTLSDRVMQIKNDILMTYKSQRPYVFLLRNAFVRRNELFFQYPSVAAESVPAPALVRAVAGR
jgi:LmbE family N-acetylglucosaminyl deacetylase